MQLLLLFLLIVLAVGVRPKSASTLLAQGGKKGTCGGHHLTGACKKTIEDTILYPWFNQQTNAGAYAYAGVVRLCFHDSATYDPSSDTGGAHAWGSVKCNVSDECEYTSVDNAGLPQWMDALDTLYDDYALSKVLTKADFWHLTCNFAVELASGNAFTIPFKAGRTDPPHDDTSPRFYNTLPQPSGFSEVQRVFVDRLGFSYEDAVALMGAHSLGGCRPQNTGYMGSWDRTAQIFDNKFFVGMVNLKWEPHPISLTENGTVTSIPEETVEQKFQFSVAGGNFYRSVMLMTDMGLLYDMDTADCDVTGRNCQLNNLTATYIQTFANDEAAFFEAFINAFVKLQVLGCKHCYDVSGTGGKNCGPFTTMCPLPPPQPEPSFAWITSSSTAPPQPEPSTAWITSSTATTTTA